MENDQNPIEEKSMASEAVLAEILDNTRKTKNYMKWQLYITVALVVLPLLAMAAMIPMVMSSLGNVYGSVLP